MVGWRDDFRKGPIMKCFRQGTAIAIASLFAIGSTVVGATAGELKTAEEIMGFSSAKTATYKTWSADYTQRMRMLGSSMAVDGRLLLKLPGRMWMQMDMPMAGQKGKMTMILGEDGIMWQISEMGSQPQVMRVDVGRVYSNATSATGGKYNPLDQMDPSKHWEVTREIYDYKKVDGGEVDGQPVYVMEGLLKPGAVTNQQFAMEAGRVGKMRVSIGKDDGFVRRFEQYDKSLTNVIMAMEFKNLKFNPAIPDSTFVYRPPTNAVTTDLTQSILAQMRQQGISAPGAPGSAPPPPPSVPKPN